MAFLAEFYRMRKNEIRGHFRNTELGRWDAHSNDLYRESTIVLIRRIVEDADRTFSQSCLDAELRPVQKNVVSNDDVAALSGTGDRQTGLCDRCDVAAGLLRG